MNDYDRYADNLLNAHLDAQDALDAEYDEVREDLIDDMKGYDVKFTSSDHGSEFTTERLYDVQGKLLSALAKGDDAAILKIMYASFEEEVEALTSHIIDNR
jgi:hypothetical protein